MNVVRHHDMSGGDTRSGERYIRNNQVSTSGPKMSHAGV